MPKISSPADLGALFDAFNAHDIDSVMTYFADDAVFYAAAGDEVCGKTISGAAAIGAAFTGVWGGMADANWAHHGHSIDGDRAVSEWTFSGTDKTGMRTEAQGVDLFTLRDGLIVVKQAFRKTRPPFKA